MKRIAIATALLSAALFAFDLPAQPPGKQGKGAGQGQSKGGFGGRRGPGGQGGPGGAMGQRDPAEMVARMMSEFDQDGDQKLDATELTALLQNMRSRRGQAMGQGPGQRRGAGQGRPGAGQGGGRPGGAGQGRPGGRPGGKGRRGGDEEQDVAGGKVPKRPAAE